MSKEASDKIKAGLEEALAFAKREPLYLWAQIDPDGIIDTQTISALKSNVWLVEWKRKAGWQIGRVQIKAVDDDV